MTAAKNQVQELLQKLGKPFPEYISGCGGQAHCLRWHTYAVVDGKRFTSRLSNHASKKLAENDCAMVIYEYLQTVKPPAKTIAAAPKTNVRLLNKAMTGPNGDNYYIWVDVDNSRYIWDKLIQNSNSNCIKMMRGFCGPCVETDIIPQLADGITTITSTSTNMKDSADYALFADLLLYVDGNIKNINPSDIFLVISRDGSLETACYYIKDRYPAIDIRYIAKESDIFARNAVPFKSRRDHDQ